MKTKSILLGLVTASSLLVSCFSTDVSDSKDVNQEKVYQKYKVTVREGDNEVNCDATFRFDSQYGNTLHLTEPSKVTANGEEMQGDKKFLVGYMYETEVEKTEVNTYTFSYINNDGKAFTNAITINPVAFSKNVPQTISKAEKNKINWEGEKLGKHEELKLFITVNDTSHATISVDRRGNKQFKINPSDFTGFAPGPGKMKIERYIKKDLDEKNSVGGTMKGEFKTNYVEFELTE